METDDTRRRASVRRARVVCHRCHEKKIRCDLPREGATCSACLDAAIPCEFRPSRKGHRRKKVASQSQEAQDATEGLVLTEQPASQLTSVPADESNYLRTLLGHQSEPQSTRNTAYETNMSLTQACDNFMPGMIRNYLETYSEICFPWCPILDIEDSTTTTGSLLLDHALAAVASGIKLSLMPGISLSREHYERARHLFYAERQDDTLTLIKTALLLSCCENGRTGSPIDSTFWWLGTAIRLAQSMRLHRAPRTQVHLQDMRTQRRIWWTLFARERIIALSQGRPCLVDESDCNIGQPRIDDFPENRSREARIFIQWVGLCRIMGDMNKHMAVARHNGVRASTQSIAGSLSTWLQSRPDDMQLAIQEAHTAPFSKEVHMLHLPYLTTIALIRLVNLNTPGQDSSEVSVTAVLAAACTARIMGDMLLRGCISALPEDSGWFITIAIIALMHIRPQTSLAKHAAADIHILRSALMHMSEIWSSAKVTSNFMASIVSHNLISPTCSNNNMPLPSSYCTIYEASADRSVVDLQILAAGVDKLMDQCRADTTVDGEGTQDTTWPSTGAPVARVTTNSHGIPNMPMFDEVPVADLFPFITDRTSPLIATILAECPDSCPQIWSGLDLDEYFNTLWNELFAGQTDLAEVTW